MAKCQGYLDGGIGGGGQMICYACSQTWGLKDPVPECLKEQPKEGRPGCRGMFYPASEEVVCTACAQSWPLNDPSPPACKFPLMTKVPEALRAAAATYEERNAIYGNNYQRMGALMLALFPEGGIPSPKTPEEASRLNLIIDCLGKLQRYAFNFHNGGHYDSAHDLCVYAAMLAEETKR